VGDDNSASVDSVTVIVSVLDLSAEASVDDSADIDASDEVDVATEVDEEDGKSFNESWPKNVVDEMSDAVESEEVDAIVAADSAVPDEVDTSLDKVSEATTDPEDAVDKLGDVAEVLPVCVSAASDSDEVAGVEDEESTSDAVELLKSVELADAVLDGAETDVEVVIDSRDVELSVEEVDSGGGGKVKLVEVASLSVDVLPMLIFDCEAEVELLEAESSSVELLPEESEESLEESDDLPMLIFDCDAVEEELLDDEEEESPVDIFIPVDFVWEFVELDIDGFPELEGPVKADDSDEAIGVSDARFSINTSKS
jgi:hypothetical protein